MKKIAVLFPLLAISINSYAFPIHHHLSKQLSKPHPLSSQKEDFTGLWTGTCSNENYKLNIKQLDNKLSITLESKDDLFEEKFSPNKLDIIQSFDGSTNFVRNIAVQDGNMLILNSTNLHVRTQYDNISFFEDNLSVFILKEGNVLHFSDMNGKTKEPCLLSKSN